jgi:hypothetical protein
MPDMTRRIFLDAGMVITRLVAESGGTEVMIVPSFRRTDRGLLFERYDGTVGASTSMTLAFTYRQRRGMEILAVSFTDIRLMK